MYISLGSVVLLGIVTLLLIRATRTLCYVGSLVGVCVLASQLHFYEARDEGDLVVGPIVLRFPLEQPEVALDFGRETSRGVHLGVDLVPGGGDRRVFPVAPGTVVCSGWNGGVGPGCGHEPPVPAPAIGLGWFLVIEHESQAGVAAGRRPLYSLYAHLEGRPSYATGDVVTGVDAPVGMMGASGGSNGMPHLHLEIQDGQVRQGFTLGDAVHGFSYAPIEAFYLDSWYRRFLDPLELLAWEGTHRAGR